MCTPAGGAGGKGVWGAPGSELIGSEAVSDTHDPNYDSDSQVSTRQTGTVHGSVVAVIFR